MDDDGTPWHDPDEPPTRPKGDEETVAVVLKYADGLIVSGFYMFDGGPFMANAMFTRDEEQKKFMKPYVEDEIPLVGWRLKN